MEHKPKIIPIVMAGGGGTRLWPVSRDTMPKQFIDLLNIGESTFQLALRRVSGPTFDRPIVITHNEFRFVCAEQLARIGVAADIVIEPERKDSAIAIAVGAIVAEARSPGAICVAIASDHIIEDGEAFLTAIADVACLASTGRIMTLGIKPTSPSTQYGYIQAGTETLGVNAFSIEAFVEKPDLATARSFISSGYLWNSGNFAFAASTMTLELEYYVPEVLDAARNAVAASTRDLDFIRLEAASFSTSPKISIDYAVMEKTTKGGVYFSSFAWSDVGSWESIHSFLDKDKKGNVLQGRAFALESTNSFVRSDGVLTAVLGLQDVIVVASHDAVLVTSMDMASRVKDVVAILKAEGRPEATEHLRIHRPWGWYQRIDIGERFQVKHICVVPGGRLSLQRHYHRAEHWVVVQGTAEVTMDESIQMLHENEAAFLPSGCVHRLHNPGKIDLKLIEVQVGSYTGEDDIVRIDDVYARN